MNRKFRPLLITSYYETIRDVAQDLEVTDDGWTLGQLITLIKQRYEVPASSFEKQVVLHLQELLDRSIVKYLSTKEQHREPKYSFGFFKEDSDEEMEEESEEEIWETNKNPRLLARFPDEILFRIFELFNLWEIRTKLVLVCWQWNRVGMDPRFNHTVEIKTDLTDSVLVEWKDKLKSFNYSQIRHLTFRQESPLNVIILLKNLYDYFLDNETFWWGQLRTLRIIGVRQNTKTDRLLNLLKDIIWSLEKLEWFSLQDSEITGDIGILLKNFPEFLLKLDLRSRFSFVYIEPLKFIFPNLRNLKLPKSATAQYLFRLPNLRYLDCTLLGEECLPLLRKHQLIARKLLVIRMPDTSDSILPYFRFIPDIRCLSIPIPRKKADISFLLKTFENLTGLVIRNPTGDEAKLPITLFSGVHLVRKLNIEHSLLYRFIEVLPTNFPLLEELKLNYCNFVVSRMPVSFERMSKLRKLEIILTPTTDLGVVCSAISNLSLRTLVLRQDEMRFDEKCLLLLCSNPLIRTLESLEIVMRPDITVIQQIVSKCKKLRKFISPLDEVELLKETRPDVQYILSTSETKQ